MLKNILKKAVSVIYILCIVLIIILVSKMVLYKIPPRDPQRLPEQIRMSFYSTPEKRNIRTFGKTIKTFIQNPLEISSSYKNKEVYTIIENHFPTSLKLGILGFLSTIIIGFFAGLASALYKNKPIDKIFKFLTFLGTYIPFFFIAILINYIFSVKFNLVSCSRVDSFKYIIIPIIATLFPCMPIFINYMRESFIEILNSNYVQYAKAKGVSNKDIILKHVLKNSLIKVINIIPLLLVTIFTSLLIIENIFSIKGLSFPIISSLYNKDLNLVFSILFFIICIATGFNILLGILRKIIASKYCIKIEETNYNLSKALTNIYIYVKINSRTKSIQFKLIIINIVLIYFSFLNCLYYEYYIFIIVILIFDLIISTFLFYKRFKSITKSLIFAFIFSTIVPICSMLLFYLFFWCLWQRK